VNCGCILHLVSPNDARVFVAPPFDELLVNPRYVLSFTTSSLQQLLLGTTICWLTPDVLGGFLFMRVILSLGRDTLLIDASLILSIFGVSPFGR